MEKRYKPKCDKLFYILFSVTNLIVLVPCIIYLFFDPTLLWIFIPITLFCNYFLVSPLFGYAELRESELFIKYGFIIKRSIPYLKIRSVSLDRKFYSETMLSLKNSFEHVIIKYNRFDVTCVSVKENADFIADLSARINEAKAKI